MLGVDLGILGVDLGSGILRVDLGILGVDLVHCPRAATTFAFPLFRLLRPLVALLFLDVVKNFLLSSS
jgi:hypothetical protein